jgi:small multidrug resistance pump
MRKLAFLESEMPDKLLPWVLLFAAILLEVAGHHLDEALARLLGAVALACGSNLLSVLAGAVSLALKWLDLSVTYAISSGVGTALAAFIGIAYFRKPLTLFKLALSHACDPRGGWLVAGRAAD